MSNPASHLYLDFDSFFASAEQHFNPDLRGRPVGVVPFDAPTTGCIAVSREVKRAGIPARISMREARALLPAMVFVVARPDAYVRLHNRIMSRIETVLPIGEVKSIDELVCHLSPDQARDPVRLARQIKQMLVSEFSETLTCSIGIAQSELQAKIAAEMEKPDGLVVLAQGDFPHAIAGLELSDIPGISQGIQARLSRAGIYDVGSLWQVGRKHARALWGSIEGERFWCGLHGEYFERPETSKNMFGHSRMLPPGWRNPDMVYECARQLLLSAARRLRRSHYAASRISFSVRGKGHRNDLRGRWGTEVAVRPAKDDRALLEGLNKAMETYRCEVLFTPRSVGVTLHGLVEAVAPQPDLFADMGLEACGERTLQAKRRDELLSDTLDILRRKFGPAAATFGAPTKVPGGYLGAKIAFGRIPDEADFNENPTEDSDTRFVQSG